MEPPVGERKKPNKYRASMRLGERGRAQLCSHLLARKKSCWGAWERNKKLTDHYRKESVRFCFSSPPSFFLQLFSLSFTLQRRSKLLSNVLRCGLNLFCSFRTLIHPTTTRPSSHFSWWFARHYTLMSFWLSSQLEHCWLHIFFRQSIITWFFLCSSAKNKFICVHHQVCGDFNDWFALVFFFFLSCQLIEENSFIR